MYPAMEWLILAFLAAGLTAFLGRKVLRSKKVPGDAFFWSIVLPAIVFFGILEWFGRHGNVSDRVITLVNAFFDWAARELGLRFAQLFVAFVTAVVGLVAHYFKKRNQKWYGLVEIVVGLLTAYFVAGTLTRGNLELAKWTTLAGAAYVIARGVGNYSDGNHELNAPGSR